METLVKPKKRIGGSDVAEMEGVKVPEGYSKIAVFEFDDVSPASPARLCVLGVALALTSLLCRAGAFQDAGPAEVVAVQLILDDDELAPASHHPRSGLSKRTVRIVSS
eukprot:893723-Rhodomonas_salina.2